MASLVTLRDGSKVSLSLVTTTYQQLEDVQEKNPIALWDLAMKCRDASHLIGPLPGPLDPTLTLQEYGLLDNREKVHQDVRQIVLNSIENIDDINVREVCDLVLINPVAKLKTNDSSNSNRWNWCPIV